MYLLNLLAISMCDCLQILTATLRVFFGGGPKTDLGASKSRTNHNASYLAFNKHSVTPDKNCALGILQKKLDIQS